ncbi:MAG: Hsp20/alpha crystallin family protein [Gemmataceae bacterium]|nr:Hsp20/alpha crystallin family protein [Gemmataceae bacterium]
MRRISWNLLPVSPLQSFFSADLEQVFDQLVQGLKSPDPNPGQPLRLNVWESGQTVIVEGDLPGVDPENLSIEVGPDGLLEINAKSEAQPLPEGATWVRRERKSRDWNRSLQLPFRVDPSKVEATLKNGRLVVTITKQAENGPRRIPVSHA